jgi:hypothetical protein
VLGVTLRTEQDIDRGGDGMKRGLITGLLVIVAAGGGTVAYKVMTPKSRPSPVTVRTSVSRPRKSMITGEVFVAMKSGSIDHASNIEVLVVPRTDEFDHDWQREVDRFTSEYRAATAVITDAQSAYRKAAADTAAAHERRMEAIARGVFDSTAYEEANRRANELAQHYDRLVADRDVLAARHEASAIELLRKYSVASVRTDVDGNFQFPAMKPGRYMVFAAHRVFEDRFHWFVPVELGGERTRSLQLSNGNEGWAISPPPRTAGALTAEARI